MREYTKRRGFSLVELLIVIIIIAVLAGMMMLSSDEAAISAKAAEIISDMENIKAAAAAYYLDHYREIDSGQWLGFDPTDKEKEKAKQLDSEDKATNDLWSYLSNTPATAAKKLPPSEPKDEERYYKYSLGGDPGTDWYVWCRVPDRRVKKKLQARQGTLELVTPVRQPGHNRHHSTAASVDKIVNSDFVGLCIFKRED